MDKPSPLALFAGLLAAAIWGGMYVVSKVVLEVVPPFLLLSSRLVLGFAALWSVVLLRERQAGRAGARAATRRLAAAQGSDKGATPRRLGAAQVLKLLAVGLVGYGISLGFQFVGTKLSTAANGSLVTSATPALVLPFAFLLLGERMSPRSLLAMLVASLGVLAVIDPRTASLSPNLFAGNLCLLGAAITWALYSVLVRKVAPGLDLVKTSAILLLGGLPVTVPAGLWELSTQGIGTVTVGIVGGILFLGIISTAVAMFLWNYAFAMLPAAVASLTFFAQPVVGTLLGWLFLGERVTLLFAAGGALIGVGILIAARSRPA